MQGQTLIARNPTPVPHSAQLFREVAALDDNTRSGLNWQMRTIYLHGFASSPSSKKAAFFRQRLPEIAALPCQSQRERPSDAAAGTRNDGDATVQRSHGFPPIYPDSMIFPSR